MRSANIASENDRPSITPDAPPGSKASSALAKWNWPNAVSKPLPNTENGKLCPLKRKRAMIKAVGTRQNAHQHAGRESIAELLVAMGSTDPNLRV